MNNIHDKEINQPQDYSDNEHQKQEKSPVKISEIAQSVLMTVEEQILPCLKELLTIADKIDPRKNQKTEKTALRMLEKNQNILKKALNAETHILEGLASIAVKQLAATPSQQFRRLRDMELYLTILSKHSNTSLDPGEAADLASLVKEVRETLNRFSDAISPGWISDLDKIEALIKEELQQKNISQTGISVLNTHKGTPLTAKIFAAIFLEDMIKGSSLEGNQTHKVVSYLKEFLENHKNDYREIEEFSSILKMVSDEDSLFIACEGLSQSIMKDFEKKMNSLSEAYHQSLSKAIKELKPKEKTLIPIGWCGLDGGHSMQMEIGKEADNSFCVLIYNTGAGAGSYHPIFSENGKNFVQPFIKLANIQVERLLDHQFSQSIVELEMVTITPGTDGKKTYYGPQDIYGMILNSLGGEIVPCTGDREKFMAPQLSGICTWASLSAVLHTNLSTKDFYRLISGIGLDSICSFYQSVKNEIIANEESRLMLQHASVKCSQIALEAYQNKSISFQELQTVYVTLKDLQNILNTAEAQCRHDKISEESISFENVEPANPIYAQVESWGSIRTKESKPISLPKTAETTPAPFSFDWMNDPRQIKDGLNRLMLQVKNAGEIEGGRILEKFFRLQAKEGALKVWNTIPVEQLSAVTVQLADLDELLLNTADAQESNLNEYTTFAYYLSALSLLLSRRNPEIKHYVEENGIEYQNYNNLVASSLNNSLLSEQNLYNPEDRLLRNKTLGILKSQKKIGLHLNSSMRFNDWCKFPDYSSANPYTHSELRYINDLLEKNPSLISKLAERYPNNDRVKIDRGWQVALALCDWYGDTMPPVFCALRRQALTAEIMLQKMVPLKKGVFTSKIEKEKSGTFNLIFQSVIGQKKWATVPSDFASNEVFEQLIEIRIRQSARKKYETYDAENDVMLRHLPEWEKNLQLILARGDLNEGNQFPEQQVIKTISYFSEHLDQLDTHNMRMLCRTLLFEENYLEKILEHNPATGRLLADFIQKGFNHFMERGNLAAGTFFIEIGRVLETFPQLDKNISIFKDIRKLCLDILSKNNGNNQERTLIYQQIAASYESHAPQTFTKEDTILLLKAIFHDEIFRLNEHKATKHVKDQIKRAYWRFSKNIEMELKGKNGSDICQAIMSTFVPNFPVQTWNCTSHYPFCVSKDGLHIINVKSLTVQINNQSLAPLPIKILENKDFQKLFSKTDYAVKCIGRNKYEFIDERGIPTQIIQNERFITISQQFEDGRWYKLTNQILLGTSFIDHLPNDFLRLCDKSTMWIPQRNVFPLNILVKDSTGKTTHTIPLIKEISPPELSPIEQKELFEFLTRKTIHGGIGGLVRKEILKIFKISNEITNHLTKNEVEEIETEIAQNSVEDLLNEDTLESKEISDFIKSPPLTPLKNILQKLLPALKHEDRLFVGNFRQENHLAPPWYLTDIKNGPNVLLRKIFNDGMLWKDEYGSLKELQLPSMGLTFKMHFEEGRYQAYSNEYPGFFVASNQRCNSLEAIDGAVVLENRDGKRKLILPFGDIKPKKLGSFSTEMSIDVKSDSTTPSIFYDLDKTLKPIAKTKEQQLYLANIRFMQKNYKQAQELLRASFSNVLPYSNKEISQLIQFAKTIDLAEDNSPHAAAVACLALSFLHKIPLNEVQWNSLAPKLPSLGGLFENYKNSIDNIPHLRLTPNEETATLNLLIDHLSTFENNNQFTGKSNPTNKSLIRHLNGYLPTNQTNSNFGTYPNLQEIQKKAVTPTSASSLNLAISKEDVKGFKLLTRPEESFFKNFYTFYDLALKDPVKLELSIAAAAQDPIVPDDLVTLLRSVGFSKANKNFDDFPPTLDALKQIIGTQNDGKFSIIMNQAREIKKIMQQKAGEKQAPFMMQGSVNKYPRPEEAQNIMQRQDKASPIKLREVSPRKEILNAKQLMGASAASINSPSPSEKLNQEFFAFTPNLGLQLSSNEIVELQQAITGTDKNSISPEAQERAKHIGTYWNLPEHTAPWHYLDPKKLPTLKTLLLTQQAEMGKRLNRMEQELLAFANELPADDQESLLIETEIIGNLRQPISMRDIIIFSARAANFTLSGKNAKLAYIEKELLDKSISYFDAKAQQQQLLRAITSINILEKTNPSDKEEYGRLSEACYKELTRQPAYEAHQNPEQLIFEVMEGIGLHAWQVSDLDCMLKPKEGENPNIILEKTMGSGKTKVYLPLLALSKADGDHIAFIVVHSSQFESVAPAMQINSGQNFAQVAHTLNFSRDSDTSLEGLQAILDQLKLVQKQRHFFVVTDKSLHSLRLAFTQLWDTYLSSTKMDESMVARIEKMREILNLLLNKGKGILDEADLLLNCRHEVVYSIGDPKPLKKSHADLVADLYKSIQPHVKSLIPFTQSGYLAKKPELIQSFILEVVSKNMPKCDQNKITDYLHGGKTGADYVDGLPKEQRDLLAIAFYEFKELLPIVLDRRCNEHFGYSDNPDKILPVPFVASGVPSPKAEFSFPYALLDYTMETLQSEGVTPSLLKGIISEMQSRAANEMKSDSNLSLQNTQAYQAFYELCGKDGPNKIFIPFLKVNDKDVSRLHEMYRKNPEEIYEFAKKYVFPAVTIYPRKFTSRSFTLGNLFKETQGFTGTPWNSNTFPKHLKTIRDVNSAGKTEGIMWKNSQTVHPLNVGLVQDTIEEISKIQRNGDYRAFIDVGAIFNGQDNQTVAEAMLKSAAPEINGVLFFKDNQACVLERGNKIVPFGQGRETKDLYIFYDQWHTTGTDFQIWGKSLLSVGKNNKMRDVEQGYMRDRQAAKGKRVEWILSRETEDYIKKELRLQENGTVGTAEIERCMQINQDRELEEQLMLSTFGKIKEVINNHLQKVLLNPKVDPAKIKEKKEKIQHLIGDNVEDSPYKDLGRYKESQDSKLFFQEIINSTINEAIAFLTDPMLCPAGSNTETIEQELWECVDLDLLPKKISTTANNTSDQLVEQQSQQENLQENTAMVNKEIHIDVEKQNLSGPIHWNFDSSKNIASRSFYRVIRPEALQKETLPVMNTTSIPWIPKSQGQAPFMPLSAIFAANKELKEFSDIFDIEVSYNFLPVVGNTYENKKLTPAQTAPFQKGQLAVNNLLICHDKSTGDVQVRLLSQADAGFFFENLKGLEKNRRHELDTTLYHLKLKVIQSSKEAILQGKEDLEEKAFGKIIQSKFFNGESIYNKEELNYLNYWIRQKGPSRMERLFREHIISQNEEKQRTYQNSSLFKVFESFKKAT